MTNTDQVATETVDLAITGMTCASCSARIERKLNKLDGVEASVNLATEKAQVAYAAPITLDDVLSTVAATGYSASPIEPKGMDPQDHMNHDVITGRPLQIRAIVATALAFIVVLLAMVPPIRDAAGNAGPWLQFLLTTPVYAWAAWPFHRAAVINARHGASTMDTLVSIGITAAYGWSVVALFTGFTDHLYFETAAIVTSFLLIGRYIEARAKSSGRSALSSLLELGAKEANVLTHDDKTGAFTEVPTSIDQLTPGMQFVVRPGEKVATDGKIVEGESTIDTSVVTGESVPVDVSTGDEVIGATINQDGRLVVEATAVGSQTVLSRITRLVEQAQTGKAPIQRLADRVSAVFVPIVLVIAALTFVLWLVTGHSITEALEPMVAVLIIACPCALGLATPTALLTGTGRGAQLGILIKGPQILESTRAVDTIVLDKTGTVTEGKPELRTIVADGNLDEDQALRAAAAIEAGSEHPIARAIVNAATERGLDIPRTTRFSNLPGRGARATIKNMTVTVGKAELFANVPLVLSEAAKSDATTVFVGWDGQARAALAVADQARPTSKSALSALKDMGLTPYLLTGDNQLTAEAIATEVGIDPAHVRAGVLPQDKHEQIAKLQADGKIVAMVGDGVNDAAALAQADLGLAMGSGTDIAMESADIVLIRPDLETVVDSIGLSRETLKIIKQNLAWAFGYNTAAIPLAAFGLLNPMIAGAAMAASSVIVVLNSLRLRGFGK